MKIKTLSIVIIAFFLISCASLLVQHDYKTSEALSESQYAQHGSTKGVVLLAANWSRAWNCGGFENAELRSIGFDRWGKSPGKDKPPDFVVNGSAGRAGFINYAFLLEPGTYAVSHAKVKVAKSISDVGYYTATRSELFKSDTPKGGTFEVAAGQVVYIGHFGLDCTNQPIMWRFYIENMKDFQTYVGSYKPHYPYLDLSNVQYRLFKTKMFGKDFSLH